MNEKRTIEVLRLIRGKNIGCTTFWRLFKIYGSVFEAVKRYDEYNQRKNLKNPIFLAAEEDIEREIVACEKIGAKFVTYFDDDYPKLLKYISSPPPLLTCIGNTELFSYNTIAVVGARNASAHGINFAKKISKDLGKEGYVIVSGFARGIDTSAHSGSLDTGTIAVLAGGIDNIYPIENEGLYNEISKKGLIVSELPFGMAPRTEHFPARNRIISGLSKGVLIVEASLRSGTIHTANQAIEQNREIFVSPGAPYDPRCEGSNKLLKDGAILVSNYKDIIEELKDFKIKDKNIEDLLLSEEAHDFNEKEDLSLYNFDEADESKHNTDDYKEQILSLLNTIPIDIESLNKNLNLEVNKLNSILMELELEDKIIFEFGKVSLK